MKLWTSIYKSCYLNLLYPEQCQHCEKLLGSLNKTLCKECFELLSFTKVKEHCKRCYEPVEERGRHPFCERCFKSPSPFYRTIFPVEPIDAGVTLHAKLKQFSTAFIAKGLTGILGFHYLSEDLPIPDIIVPMPDPLWKKMIQGPNASHAIAKKLSQILNVPYVNALSKTTFTGEYKLKKNIENKKVLLVSEKRSQNFFTAGEALIEGAPSMILGAGIFN